MFPNRLDRRSGLLVGALCLLMLLASTSNSEPISSPEPLTVRHYQADDRYAFGQAVLVLALSLANPDYEVVPPEEQNVNEARGERMVVRGELDVQWMSTTAEREANMLAVAVPIYRGILGLRLLLVTPDSEAKLATVRSLADLRQFIGGHGAHWKDLPVYSANQLPVKAYGNYQTLFRLLKEGRFDYFHRGLNEIWQEQARHSDSLIIARDVMLFYPHPVYFFVTKSRPQLAADIQLGLERATQDGSYKALFIEYHRADIERANLPARHLIRLQNPVIPASTPPLDTSWWMPSQSP